MKVFIPLFVAVFGLNALAVDSSGLLLSAFCPNTGTQTAQALNQSQQLGNIVEILKTDPECSGLASGTQNLINNVASLESIRTSADETSRIREKLELFEENAAIERSNILANFEAQFQAQYMADNPSATTSEVEQQVSLAVGGHVPYSDYLSSLELTVNELRIEQFSNRLEVGFDADDRAVEHQQIALIQSNMSSLLSTLSTSTSCTNANESIAPAVVSNVLGLASSVIPGIVGSVVGLGASIVNGSAQLIRNLKYNGLSRSVERNQMKQALSCTFEGLTNTYCKAQDSLNLIKYNQEMERDNCFTSDCKLLKVGIDLLSKKSNSLNSWINLIISGATPSNADAVFTYERAINLQARFNINTQELEGVLNGARNELSRPGARETTILRNLMETLATRVAFRSFEEGNSFGTGRALPYADFFQRNGDKECGAFAYFFNPDRDDRQLEERDATNGESCIVAANNTYPLPLTVSIAELQERVRLLTEETSATVAFQVQLVSEENTSSILSRYESVDNLFNSSPKRFLKDLRKYYADFESYLDKNDIDRPLLRNYIERAVNQSAKVETIIRANSCTDFDDVADDCDVETTKLTLLRRTLAPSQQVLSVQNSLRGIFREHVEISKLNNDISDEDLLLLLDTSTEDSSNILARNNLDQQAVLEDADTAKSISKGNLKNFWDIFERGIYGTLKELRRDGDLNVLGRLCVRAAISPLSKRQYRKLTKYCGGTVYKSVNPKIADIKFDDVINKAFESKACSVFNFKRRQLFLNNN